MNLAARVRKLELVYRPFLLCLSCQYWAAIGQRELRVVPTRATVAIQTCPFCGTKHEFDLKNYDAPAREVISLILQADPIKRHHDERFCSAACWYQTCESEVKTYQQAINSEDRLRFFAPYPPPAIHTAPTSTILSSRDRRNKQKIDELKQLADSFVRKETEKIKRSINAPKTFPVVNTVQQISTDVQILKRRRMAEILNNVDQQSDSGLQLEFELNACFVHLEKLQIRQAHEMVLWGHSLIVTLDEMRFFESEIEKKAAEAMLARVPLELEELGIADEVLEPPGEETLGETASVGLEQNSPISGEFAVTAGSMNNQSETAQEGKSWTCSTNAVTSEPLTTINNPSVSSEWRYRTRPQSPYYRRVQEPSTFRSGRYTSRNESRFRRASD